MAEEAKWYVVHTYSGYENKVADSIVNAVENRQLHHLITDVKIPTEMVVEIKDDGQKVEKEQKLFPSYVFVKMIMTDDSWYVVRNIRGVTGFVGPGSKPVPLTEAEIERFQVENRQITTNYAVGDSVEVTGGYLEGFVGVVDAIDTVSAKIELIVRAEREGIPVISSMGTGNKLDPTAFEVEQIEKTSVCPLAKVMRRELKKRGISGVKVVYSKEEPVRQIERGVPASVSFVPPVAGMILAGEVIKDLIKTNSGPAG